MRHLGSGPNQASVKLYMCACTPVTKDLLFVHAGGQEPMMSVLATEDQASWGCKRTCQKVPPGMGAVVRSLWAI